MDLSALEFRLLAAFVKRSGRLLARAQLLDEVWGSGQHVTDRVVDNQVTNLRKKIEPNPERPRYLVFVARPRLPLRWRRADRPMTVGRPERDSHWLLCLTGRQP